MKYIYMYIDEYIGSVLFWIFFIATKLYFLFSSTTKNIYIFLLFIVVLYAHVRMDLELKVRVLDPCLSY